MVFWSSNGDSFVIANTEKFITILPKYYKTQNYSSFVRQLNMYDFHKIKNSKGFHEFRHERFKRGNLQDLKHIKRKINDMIDGIEPAKADASTLLAEQGRLQESIVELEESLKNLNAQNKILLQANHEFIYSLYHQKTNNDLKYRKLLFLMHSVTQNYLPEVMIFFKTALGQKNNSYESVDQDVELLQANITRFVHQTGKNLLSDSNQYCSHLDKLLEISMTNFRNAGQMSASTMTMIWEDFLRSLVSKDSTGYEESMAKPEDCNWASHQPCQFADLDNDSHFDKDSVLDLKSENFNEMDLLGKFSRQQSSIKSMSDRDQLFEIQKHSFCLQSPHSESSGV